MNIAQLTPALHLDIMRTPLVFLFTAFLCVNFQRSFAGKFQCVHGGRLSETRTFFDNKDNFVIVSLPCRYKLANLACHGDRTEIIAENSVDETSDEVAYMTGVTVNITTVNDNARISYQTLTITNDTLKQYMDKEEYDTSPWTWASAGSEVDQSKKVTGQYDLDTQLAVVNVGKLTVSFRYVSPSQFRLPSRPTLKIECGGRELQAFEKYPQTVCGSLDNSHKDMLAVDDEVPADPHHQELRYRNDYVILAHQLVEQKNPLCEEARSIVTSSQCSRDLGDVMHECDLLTTGISYSHYGKCIRKHNLDFFKVYVTCLRVLCETSGYSSQETCKTLQEVDKACGDIPYAHMKISSFLSKAECQSKKPKDDSPPAKYDPYPKKRKDTCRVADRELTKGSKEKVLGYYHAFSKRSDVRVELPCRYKLANITCGGVHTIIDGDHSIDKEGLAYLSGVTVTMAITSDDGTLTRHMNKISNRKFKQYIARGKFKKNPWQWSYAGPVKPKKDEQVTGDYNNTTKSAVLIHKDLTVTFTYIDPKASDRPVSDILTIQCDDKRFKADQVYPDTLCGGPKDSYYQPLEDVLGKELEYDKEHYDLPKDLILLATQDVKQTCKYCKEASTIVAGDCKDLGDKLYECYMIAKPKTDNSYWFLYGECMRNNSIDTFKVYVSCLRVLCETETASSESTCNTLQHAETVCGDLARQNPKHPPHMPLTDLISRAKCPPPGTNTIKT